jgi:GAF domain-containing protein
VRLTLIVGAVTVAAAFIAAVISTSGLTSETWQNRDLRVIQGVEDAVESHLGIITAALEQATSQTRETELLTQRLAVFHEGNQSSVERVILANQRGIVINAIPDSPDAPKTVRREPAFLNALAGGAGFITRPAHDGKPWELWFTRTVIDAEGEPLLVLMQFDTSFLETILRDSAQELTRRTIVLMEGPEVVASSSETTPTWISSARWTVEGPQWGGLTVTGPQGNILEGHYNDIGLEGTAWRAVVFAPRSEQTLDVMRTVTPPVFVMLVGGAIALLVSWAVALRVARPLRDLERAALSAAAGSYVRPLSTDRDDEIGRVSEAFNAVAVRLNALHDLSQLLASASRLDQVLDGILAAVDHLVGPGASAVYLLDEEQELLVPVRARGRSLARVEPVKVRDGDWLTRSLGTSDPVSFHGSRDELAQALPGILGKDLEVVAAPLVSGSEPLGAVVVAREVGRSLSEAEREMLRTFSAQAAVAVQTSRLFEIESASRRNAEALKSVAEQLVSPTSLETALTTVEGVIAELFGAHGAIIGVVDRGAVGLSAAESVENESAVLAIGRELFGENADNTPLLIARGDSPAVDGLLDQMSGSRLLVVPIALDTDHGALLAVANDDRYISADAMEFGRALGDEIALALDNAYFFQRAVTRAANLETIFRISQAVGSSLQINVVLNRVLDVVQKILSADAVALFSFDSRRRELTTSMGRGALPADLLHVGLEPGEDIVGEVFKRGEPIALRRLESEKSAIATMALDNGLASLLAVPLLARGRSIGVLMVFSVEPDAFSDEDINVLQTFASQAALAIDTARLYSHEHEVAHVLQQSILPEELPEYDEIEAGSVYAPAGEDSDIGGDYYDLFRGPDGSIWFAIADVCGKGVQAATKTSMIKYVIRALVTTRLEPAAIISEVNNMIEDAGDPSDIVTVWLGRYDPATRRLQWANGGHPPGLVKRVDGTIERLEVTGALLGALRETIYGQSETTLAPGDRVLLYTDGVTEARKERVFFGEERVVGVLEQPGSSAQTARSLLAAVKAYVQGDLRDDVAVLVITCRDKGTRSREGE